MSGITLQSSAGTARTVIDQATAQVTGRVSAVASSGASDLKRCGGCTLDGDRCNHRCYWPHDSDWFCHQHTPNVRLLDKDDNEILRLHIRYGADELLELKKQYPDRINIDRTGTWDALTATPTTGSVWL